MTSVFPALYQESHRSNSPLRAAVTAATRLAETDCVAELVASFTLAAEQNERIRARARRLITHLRDKRRSAAGVDALMHEFSLSSTEGVALMCLAESLLRIPDAATADALIRDKLAQGDWQAHLGHSPSAFVNAASWGLMLTGKLVAPTADDGLLGALKTALARGGEPLIRAGMDHAMRMLGRQFVAGETIEQALEHAQQAEARGYRHSYDMLGEAALSDEDAQRYFAAYVAAIHSIGQASQHQAAFNRVVECPGVSVKLSALHPRFCVAQRQRVMDELLPRMQTLVRLASQYDIGLSIDAEESDRLELTMDVFEALAGDTETRGFKGLGFVVQAYQRRATRVVDWLVDLAERSGRCLMVRLVKGAYWDSEIKRAQVQGLSDYPVFTRKPHTDLSYLVCAQKLLAHSDKFFAQFATHNAHTVAAIIEMAASAQSSNWEFQCLHGMGEPLYDEIIGITELDYRCRIYAPVGVHERLLAYLVRRLLENGANTSFVSRIVDDEVAIDDLLRDPLAFVQASGGRPHPNIPLPGQLYGALRQNSDGADLADEAVLRALTQQMAPWAQHRFIAHPSVGKGGDSIAIVNPAQHEDVVGYVHESTANDTEQALQQARAYAADWAATSLAQRAAILDRAADLLEQGRAEFLALAIREAGKTLASAQAEVREAVDFMRYYAVEARHNVHSPPRGVVVCISPWNFPLAIFCGQVAAALVAGNTVIAKPAEQTPLIAQRLVDLLYAAGIPRHALHFLPGRGETVGQALVADARIDGVVFTGSESVAEKIARQLRGNGGERMLIAETGGINCMIVDASALPEQVVQDAITSAFDSAGQRCSALRILCLQEEIYQPVLSLLQDAMKQLSVGAPHLLSSDIGPVIDAHAQRTLNTYLHNMRARGHRVTQQTLPSACESGHFVAPALVEIERIGDVPNEVFGPVLHVMRWSRAQLEDLITAINDSGFGLTMGVHSRIDATVEFIARRARVGNLYVNRNMIGAVVGVQPFGGEGRSGTGPKAGGPWYLQRLVRNEGGVRPACIEGEVVARDRWRLPGPTGEQNVLQFFERPQDAATGDLAGHNCLPLERTATRNLAASGGNAALMNLNE